MGDAGVDAAHRCHATSRHGGGRHCGGGGGHRTVIANDTVIGGVGAVAALVVRLLGSCTATWAGSTSSGVISGAHRQPNEAA